METSWLITSILGLVISVPLSALLLMLSANIFKLNDTSFKTAIQIIAIIGGIGFIFDAISFIFLSAWITILGVMQFIILNVVLAILFIKRFYNLEWKQTVLVWIVWLLFSLVLMAIIAIIIGILLAAFGFTNQIPST